jgi:hypothetical protein
MNLCWKINQSGTRTSPEHLATPTGDSIVSSTGLATNGKVSRDLSTWIVQRVVRIAKGVRNPDLIGYLSFLGVRE